MSPLIGVTADLPAVAAEYSGWRDLVDGFGAVGAAPVVIPTASDPAGLLPLVDTLDGLVLSGGEDVAADFAVRGDEPAGRDRFEAEIVSVALRRGLPVLAICRGAQLLNVVLGGDLIQDIPTECLGGVEHRPGAERLGEATHDVRIADGLLARWCRATGTVVVNSQHHQAVRRLAPGLDASAWAPDGLIEGYEDADRRIVGVQWHPEFLWRGSSVSRDLLAGFVGACTGNTVPSADRVPAV